MTEAELRAIREAAASSAMEGLPLTEEAMSAVISIYRGELSIEDFVQRVKEKNKNFKYQEDI